jgi:glycosyltransferase involved in cell wall biosynthesis/GT2 family glycosyltransferase
MKLVFIDKLGLPYDGDTLKKSGLGGSESSVILMSKELQKLGFDVTVFNNCNDESYSAEGIYDGVRYIDNSNAKEHNETYDIAVVSRSVQPFINADYPFVMKAKKRVLWLHDTFVDGDAVLEELVISRKIHHVFTLSDWHTSYILNSNHEKRRNYEVLKKHVFQTRNGAVKYLDEVDLSKKDKNHFVYNSSASKGLLPLVNDIWPEIKKRIPDARLSVIGGYYRFKGGNTDAQGNTVQQLIEREDLKNLDVTFTGILPQNEIADILSNAYMMLYPASFPETFGISTVESLLYNTPIITTRFGALEETAVDLACYQIDYAIEPNNLFPNINKETQVKIFLETFFTAYENEYLHQQKQNYCNIVNDVAGWDTVALQWKQFFFRVMGDFLPVEEYRKVERINSKVQRVFGRTNTMPFNTKYNSYGKERHILIISPMWNAENYVTNHIISVAQQDYDNYTHVIINDNSNDSSHDVITNVLSSLPEDRRKNIIYIHNQDRKGCIRNQIDAIENYGNEDDFVMLLDGDDWIVNNNSIFHYYNDLYTQGYEFTYGSMWSLADNIPLIAQDYPKQIKKTRQYRDCKFNWGIPYTHLRTFKKELINNINMDNLKDTSGQWMTAGADNPLFYELISASDPDKIYCVKEIVCNYNDKNPLNDYKVRTVEQNQNATAIPKCNSTPAKKKILVAIPTSKNIEADTFKSLWDLTVPEGYELEFQHFHGYQIAQIRNLIAEWAKNYDYLLSVDSDIVLPQDALVKMLSANKDIVSGLYIQRIPNTHTLEVYMDIPNGGVNNIPIDQINNLSLVEIAACGFGCCLISGEVFRKMAYPHFVYKDALDHKHTVSEDIYFCLKARAAGFTIWADSSIKCEHIGSAKFIVST